MTEQQLRDMVDRAAYIVNRLPANHPLSTPAYDLWYALEDELSGEESKRRQNEREPSNVGSVMPSA